MTDDDFFAAQFPGTAHQLQALRIQDKEFDQICADYHEVFHELALAPQSAGGTHARYLADLAESVSDLRNSIENWLHAPDCTNE
ncbi:hypothetical protein RUE5091_03149 [Ruegeria denitrificans]|uniref:Uncharacterized protein n=1 Tax=Ruegeria denitrificans TaxID=1715692 RepID=A0A0P1IN08_9RHOB|nr:hypothetical protein [Ruegeria denitrificans]CUK09206.1 hypothetical protein RUE5091_03149 [Ruegeria denitrificans]